jgi:hypothetical protein
MINARDIVNIENKRREIKKETYKKIYEQFSRKIRQTVEFGQRQVFLTVPGFLIGFPTFDRDRATEYLKRQLERAEFTVVQTSPYEFHVSWGQASTKSKRKEPEEEEPSFDDLPTLINLKKAANKYRRV